MQYLFNTTIKICYALNTCQHYLLIKSHSYTYWPTLFLALLYYLSMTNIATYVSDCCYVPNANFCNEFNMELEFRGVSRIIQRGYLSKAMNILLE